MRCARLVPRLLVLTMALALATVGLVAAPPASATAPPALSNLRYSAQRDHYLEATFDVPAAFYSPGAYVVARLTRGFTPAASVTAGYPLQVNYKTVNPPVQPPLTADTVYTFAMWLHTSGGYSKRAYVNLKTRKDVTPPEMPEAFGAETLINQFGEARILLTWEDCCDDVVGAQIVRNTSDTRTGGTSVSVAGTRAWIDDYLPDSVRPHGSFGGYTTAPLYYFIRLKDRVGLYSPWRSTQVVPGDHTLSGHVAGAGPHTVTVRCCTNPISGDEATAAQVVTDASGDFVLHLASGRYSVCAGSAPNPCQAADLRTTPSLTLQFA